MKTYKLLFILLLLSSCNNEEKLQGTWYFVLESDLYGESDKPQEMIIKDDSIHFNYPYFNHWEASSLIVEKDSIYFKDYAIKYTFIGDTLVLNNSQKFYNKPIGRSKEYLENKSQIKIELPKFNNSLFTSESLKETPFLKFLGRRHDNNQYTLMSNESYIDFKDLINIHDYQAVHERPHDYLFIDNKTSMRDVELIIMDLLYKNQLKIAFVNNINIYYNNEESIHYRYEINQRHLSPRFNKQYLFEHVYTGNQEVPLHYSRPLSPPKFNENKYPIIKIITLEKNQLFINNSATDFNELKVFISNSIKNKAPVISLFDLESDYDSFLKINAVISSIYEEKRNELAFEIYDKKLDELDRKQQWKIKDKIPILHFWSYSIPHFKKIIEGDGTFYGLKINYNESQ